MHDDESSAILLTPGEPAGIGPDITIFAAQEKWQRPLVAIVDPSVLHERAKQLNLKINLTEIDNCSNLKPLNENSLYVLPIKLKDKVNAGELSRKNADYVIETLKLAGELCLSGECRAVVTGPVHKAIINDAGISFRGHTEFFANLANVPQTVMLFVIDELKVALLTTHLPLAQVANAVTKEKLRNVLQIIIKDLQTIFNLPHPLILVCGLNPHAGEFGHLGREEIDIITPVIDEFKLQGQNVFGPLPADTIFTQKYLQQADAILAMYHDQALPLVKYLGFNKAVNVTLGLPFIRTSVDHGTALDLAGSGKADPGSFLSAIKLAIKLAH